MERAAIYLRVSTEEQAKPGHYSIPAQLEGCEEFCRRQGYSVAARFADLGVSGARSHRPELDQMLKQAKEAAFEAIVCYNLDRLSRGIMPLSRILDVTKPLGIRLEFATERYDDSPQGEFSLEVRAAVGKLERSLIAERTSSGRLRRARAGMVPGGLRVFGYEYDREAGTLKVNQPQADIVHHLFHWVDSGRSIGSWVKLHNLLGTSTALGSARGFSRQQALKMLKNPVYAGSLLWNTTRRRDGKVMGPRPSEQWVTVPVQPIVPRELFDCVQARLQQNKTLAPRNTRAFYLLQHLLKCRECGLGFRCHSRRTCSGKVRGVVKTYRLAKPYRYYECQGMERYPGTFHCRTPGAIKAEELEKVVWEKMVEVFHSPEALIELLNLQASEADNRRKEVGASLRQAEQNLAQLELEMQRLLTLARKGLVTEPELDPQLRSVRELRQHWQAEVRRAQGQLESLALGGISPKQAQEFCDRFRGRLRTLNDEERQEFLRLVVDVIWIDREGKVDIVGIVPAPSQEALPSYTDCEPPLSLEGEGEEIGISGDTPGPPAGGCAPCTPSGPSPVAALWQPLVGALLAAPSFITGLTVRGICPSPGPDVSGHHRSLSYSLLTGRNL